QTHWALEGITTTFRPGVTWLAGPLGAGTSTLLGALAGLLPRLSGGDGAGTATLDGADVAASSPLDRGIGWLGPAPALQLSGVAGTVRDEIAVGPMNLGWPRERIRAAVEAAMARTDVAHLADRAPNALSGGETQRVLLAALLATDPQVLLLDEPCAALDHAARERIADLLVTLGREGRIVVLTCDDADLMATRADRVVVLCGGAVAADTTPAVLLAESAPALGVGSTDAATLAAMAGYPAPRPLTTEALVATLALDADVAPVRTPPSPPRDATPVLAMREASYAWPDGRPVLHALTLAVHPGEAMMVLGPNGAGKSTMLRLAMALAQPQQGVVEVLGAPTTGRHPEDLAPTVGFLFQEPERQLFAASVRAECAIGPRLAGWDRARVEAATVGILATLGLDDVAEEHPWDLPLPRRRLVALAATLVSRPQLLLLDEPTAGLDAASRDRVMQAAVAHCEAGGTLVAVTHDPVFAHEVGTRAIVMRDGRVGLEGSVTAGLDAAGLVRPAALAIGARLGVVGGRGVVADVLARRTRG
ncbi:MAG TPA: ABC transporter ATP-binding protein, partial [Gemmatimonadales bacterium]|nr:ABC transporter ATP-binding protein [Gemmatimonadales bacterium]